MTQHHATAKPCSHYWNPTPADALSAVELVGHCRCLRCGKNSTLDDMQKFGSQLKEAERTGEVLHEYDPIAGR